MYFLSMVKIVIQKTCSTQYCHVICCRTSMITRKSFNNLRKNISQFKIDETPTSQKNIYI